VSVVLHISDTHFGTEQPAVMDALRVLARERQPDVLVYSGDITQRARRPQFEAARRFADSLGIAQMLALPGNHDIPLYNVAARLFFPYAGYLASFGPRLETVLNLPDLLLIGLNTTRASRHKNGEVSSAQVRDTVSTLLAARREQLRVVVVHQPAAVYRAEDEHDRLRGAADAVQAWSAAGADLVLGGHIHLPYVIDLRAQPQPTPGPMWCVQAGTAVSTRVRHGTCNSVNLIHWRAPIAGTVRTCRVDRYDYQPAEQRFLAAETRTLALGG
jgi:3',5'-cyclic AMP phosphodiesterase CpdA